jgi:photosystem II stability/assembly factor-like uncharacterized protein
MFGKANLFLRLFVILIVLMPWLSSRAQWTEVTGLPISFTAGLAIDACDENTAVISVCGTTPEVFLTKDAGLTWDLLQLPEQGFIWDVSMVDSNRIWACSSGKIFATADGGESWTVQYDGTGITDFINYIEMFDASHGIVQGDVLSDGPVLILKTSDGGENWISMNDSTFGGWSGDLWRPLDFVNSDIGYFYINGTGYGHLMKTTNGGQHWTQLDSMLNGIEVLKFYNESIGLFSVWGGSILRTLDGGTTLDTITVLPGSGADLEFAPEDPSKVWFTTFESPIYFSSDTGRTWISQMQIPGNDVVFTDNLHGWLLSNQTIYRTTVGGGNTEVPDYVHRSGPEKFLLHQNFPNPFNHETVISFDIKEKGHVNLTVYDLLAKSVATVAEGHYPPGRYQVKFDASGLPSGIYVYRLQCGGCTEVKKMVLME